ncbi:hypothetical protein DSM112329_00529 [Paraconexibacter sp. AEG42_29]|uniref:Carboxypeptidase regulatory-like domain-containing protein n=1 Tax=Paraconexibacter sp. AEG42_29 TaxID=2997339 RepID=A0AAU7AQ15_9ACTN
MSTRPVLAAFAVAALLPTAALAAKPPKPPKPAPATGVATLGVSAPSLTFPGAVTVTGSLSGVARLGNVPVTLEHDDSRPYGDSFKPAGQSVKTNTTGGYSFAVRPARNTQYRVVVKASPSITSSARLVAVRPFVGLKASIRTPRAGRIVRFSGLVRPARNGAAVLLQRRTPSGRYATIVRSRLRASGSDSIFAIAARVRRSGTYRVKVPGNVDLINGFSRPVSVRAR